MKKTTRHIKAFTILEIVISLAIMSIIISMVYMIYGLLSKQMYSYSTETDVVNEYNQIHTLFKRDVYNATQISHGDESLLLLSNRDTISYFLDTDRLVRVSTTRNDTFDVVIEKFETSRSGVFETTSNTLEEFTIHYNLLGEQITGLYFKDFGIAEDINQLFFNDGN